MVGVDEKIKIKRLHLLSKSIGFTHQKLSFWRVKGMLLPCRKKFQRISKIKWRKNKKSNEILRLSEGRRRKSILPSVSKIKTAKAGLNVNDTNLYLDSENHEKSKKEY